jgi:hypothetical protein
MSRNKQGEKMILTNNTIEVEKSSNFQSTDFRIDAKYKNKVLWMLINQYRFKIRTPIQEIVSNARDAQRENGNPDRPIKIQLPTKIEPTFIVRDYGVGMDENRIKTIFTSFGASTKNADNTQTGGFGIGAKSPLAYTDSFNIKTYVDGKYWFYVIAKTSDDGIGINLLGHGDTTEENGTEVQIPVASGDSRKFVEGTCRSTMFWKVQPKFNLSEEDLYKVNNGTEIAEGFNIYKKSNLGNLFETNMIFVVDGIPYEVDGYLARKAQKLEDINEKIARGSLSVIELNTGDIDLLQTRESIDESEKTLSELKNIGFKRFSELELYLASCLNAKGLEERIRQFKDLSEKFNNMRRDIFETFIITGRELKIESTLSTLSYDFRDRYGSQTLSKPQRRYKFCDSYFNHNDNKEFFWDDLKDAESDNVKARRLRTFLTDTRTIPVLITQSRASNFEYIRTLRMLGAKKLSSLELPVKTVRVKGQKKAKKKVAETVTVHVMDALDSWRDNDKSTRNSRTVKLAEIKVKYVYEEYQGSYFNSSKYNFQIKKFYDVVPCKLSKTDIKAVQDDTNFISLEDFKADMKPTDAMLNYFAKTLVFNYGGNYSRDMTNTITLAKNINVNSTHLKDKVLTKMSQHVILYKEVEKVHRNFEELCEPYKKTVQNRARIIEKFLERLDTKYPLLTHRTKRSEVINYINEKAR